MIEENLTGIFELLLISSFCLFLFSYIVIISQIVFRFEGSYFNIFFSQIRKLPSKCKSSRGISLICQINIQRLITQKEV